MKEYTMTTTTTKTPTHKKRRFRRQPYAVDKTAMGLLTAKQTCDAIGITRSALLYVMKMKRLTPFLPRNIVFTLMLNLLMNISRRTTNENKRTRRSNSGFLHTHINDNGVICLHLFIISSKKINQ